MKKIFLILTIMLLVELIAYGKSEGAIDLTLRLIGGGIIISPNPDAIESENLLIDHGTFTAGQGIDSEANANLYIRMDDGYLPPGVVFEIVMNTISGENNNLTSGDKKIPRKLTLTPLAGTVEKKSIVLEGNNGLMGKETYTSDGEKKIHLGVNSLVKIDNTIGFHSGKYTNTTIVTVELKR